MGTGVPISLLCLALPKSVICLELPPSTLDYYQLQRALIQGPVTSGGAQSETTYCAPLTAVFSQEKSKKILF